MPISAIGEGQWHEELSVERRQKLDPETAPQSHIQTSGVGQIVAKFKDGDTGWKYICSTGRLYARGYDYLVIITSARTFLEFIHKAR